MREVELLAPAGDLEKLKIAFIYGADAVYIGGEIFGMRSAAKNFSKEDMIEGLEFAHNMGKKVFVTVNIIPRSDQLDSLADYIKELDEIGVDAVIVSDAGVFNIVKRVAPTMEIHISTQASTSNYIAANFWYNQGSCAQSCRWKYNLVEDIDGNYKNVLDDEDYQFFFNTKDLCMIKYIPEIFDSGITSLKIEGRMKTAYYVATTVRAYRMAIDEYYKDPDNWEFNPMWLDELKKGSHRDYSTGFFLDRPGKDSNNYESASYIRNYDFIGIVKEVLDDGYLIVEQRNKMSVGEDIEVIGPYKETMFTSILEMYDEDGEPIESAPHARQIVKMKLGIDAYENYILRKPIIKG